MLESLYRAAAQAGLLSTCVWQPPDGRPTVTHAVGFSAPDTTLLDGLTLSREYSITYPASWFMGLMPGDTVNVEGQTYLVRDVMAMGDGTECRTHLMRIVP